MPLDTSYYTYSKETSTKTDYYNKMCFMNARVTFGLWDEIYILVYKAYPNHSHNSHVLEYDKIDILSWISFLNHCKLKCSLHQDLEDRYVILLKREDFINVNHFLMCCQCIRYLYESPKTEIPRYSMKIRQQYSLLDPMECLLLGHLINNQLFYSREHSMIRGVVKLQNVWKTIEKLSTSSSLHEVFDFITDNSQRISELSNNLREGKVEQVIKYLNENK